ncbi:MAG: hypothetical protein ABH833_04345 [Parcubacteria group bacterium]
MKKYKYLLIGDPAGASFVDASKEEAQLSGLYLWSRTFKINGEEGKIETLWRAEELEEYDIVHVNYTPSNIQLPSVIRDELGNSSSTKLVINVDLDVHYWGVNFGYFFMEFIRELKLADVLFHVESKGAEALEMLLDRKVHVNPHPVDVRNMYDYMKKDREPVIGTMYHRYFPNTTIPFITQRKVPMRRILFGHVPVGKQGTVANAGMFDQIIPRTGFKDYLNEVSKCAIGCDLYEGHTFGRSVIELAALGVPTVCSSTIEAANELFPLTTIDPYDVKSAERLFIRLSEDDEFCNTVIKQAHSLCGEYSLESSYKRFVEMIETEDK